MNSFAWLINNVKNHSLGFVQVQQTSFFVHKDKTHYISCFLFSYAA